MIRLEDAQLCVAGKPILHAVTYHLLPGAHVGLVGRNGSGKTTFLRALMGEIVPDHGQVIPRPSARIAWLEQHGVAGSGNTVWEEASSRRAHMKELKARLDRAEAKVSAGEDAADALERATESWRQAGGYSEDETIGTVLHGLGFHKHDWHRSCDTFSGGWQMRVALARLLLAEPDVLLLDEPTNHLDLHARTWLANYLNQSPASVIVVSHDRFLLDKVAKKVIEVRQGKIHLYTGNFTAFQKERELRMSLAGGEHRKQQVEIKKLERFVERFGAKATKAKQAKSKQKALDRMDRAVAPESLQAGPKFRLPEAPPGALDALGVVDATLAWDPATPLFVDATFSLERGKRIALLGPNGSGKSTMLRALAGELLPLKGRRRVGDRSRIGVFTQDTASTLPTQVTPLQFLADLNPLVTPERIRAILGALGLSGGNALRPIGTLSGGERARVALASLAVKPHNILLLDEPTNHLDIETIETLVGACAAFEGAMLIVSHDRYFVEGVATHIAKLGDGKVAVTLGVSNSDFTPEVLKREEEEKDTGGAESYADRKQRSRELTRAKRRLGKVEDEISEVEVALEAIDEKLFAEAGDPKRARVLGEERNTAQQRCDDLYAEWETLELLIAEEQP